MSVRMMMQGRQGGGAPFDPASISGLGLWLDADAITGLVDGDPVSTWTNDGSAGDATGTTTTRPTYKTNIINGLPVVRFDGTDDELIVADHADIELNTDSTVFIVMVRRNTAVSGYGVSLLAKAQNSNTAGAYYYYLAASFIPRVDRPFVEGGAGSPTAPGLGVAHLLTAKVSGTTVTHRLDGTQTATDTLATGTATSTGLYICNNIPTKLPGQNDIGELLIYNSALSDADRDDVESYLSTKWSV